MNKIDNIRVGSHVKCEGRTYKVISLSRDFARLENMMGDPCGMAPVSRLEFSSNPSHTPWVPKHNYKERPRQKSSGGSSLGVWVLGIGAGIALLMSIIGGGVIMIAGAVLMAAENSK